MGKDITAETKRHRVIPNMDYYQTTDRYRKKEFRNQFSWLVRISVMMLMVWIGWFWGSSQQEARISVINEQIAETRQNNDRLAQELATITTQLTVEREKRISAELLSEQGDDKTAMERLKKIVARYLARGIKEDDIRLALQSAAKSSRCRPLDQIDLAVATSFFAGTESSAELLDGTLQVFVEGEAEQEATKERPWFDAEKPVSIRVSYLGGEKIASGQLPMAVSLLADAWMLKIDLKPANLRGYVDVNLSKCSIN